MFFSIPYIFVIFTNPFCVFWQFLLTFSNFSFDFLVIFCYIFFCDFSFQIYLHVSFASASFSSVFLIYFIIIFYFYVLIFFILLHILIRRSLQICPIWHLRKSNNLQLETDLKNSKSLLYCICEKLVFHI